MVRSSVASQGYGFEKLIADKNEFVHKENVYFIPATSIKGMVRSILEIISFGMGTVPIRFSSCWGLERVMDPPDGKSGI